MWCESTSISILLASRSPSWPTVVWVSSRLGPLGWAIIILFWGPHLRRPASALWWAGFTIRYASGSYSDGLLWHSCCWSFADVGCHSSDSIDLIDGAGIPTVTASSRVRTSSADCGNLYSTSSTTFGYLGSAAVFMTILPTCRACHPGFKMVCDPLVQFAQSSFFVQSGIHYCCLPLGKR